MGKPVLGIIPWGQQQIPQYVQNNSTELVGWNIQSIVQAIRKYV